MPLQQIVPITLLLQGDGVSTVFTFPLSDILQVGTGSVTLLSNQGYVPPTAINISSMGSPAGTATVDANSNFTLTLFTPIAAGVIQAFDIQLVYVSAAATSNSPILATTVIQAGLTGNPFSVNTGTTPTIIPSLTPVPLISLQPDTALITLNFPLLGGFNLAGNGSRVLWQIVLDGTLIGATFKSVDSESVMVYDTSASAISGGRVVNSGYMQLNEVTLQSGLYFPYAFVEVGSPPVLVGSRYTLVVTQMGSLANCVSASIQWTEPF
jgi:hypothetical protein